MLKIKEFYTSQELADLELKALPHTRIGVMKKAKKENWLSRPRSGRGGGVEYAFDSLPQEAQKEIKAKTLRAMIPSRNRLSRSERALVVAGRNVGELSDKQRQSADARILMAMLVYDHELEMSRTHALAYISQLSRDGNLPIIDNVDYNQVCATALCKAQGKGVGVRTLHEWVKNLDLSHESGNRLQVFANAKQGRPCKPLVDNTWLADFMAVYRNTNGIGVAEAYRHFKSFYHIKAKDGGVHYTLPSLTTVRYTLNKIPEHIKQIGRKTGAELKVHQTYIKRDWSVLKANDVWVGDGHSLKMKVAHPEHGRPMTPELTLIMDAPSRYIVGWSLAYSESHIAVGDALRHAMTTNGIPVIYYSDNGSGQKNKTFDADITGILPRLGIGHETGIPGNPQGRGIIERAMKTIAHVIARQFETYFGAGADKESVRRVLTATESLAKHQNNVKNKDKALTPKQQWAVGKLPTWHELKAVVEQVIGWYNQEHEHSELDGVTPAQMRAFLLSQLDDDEYMTLTDIEMRELFRPSFVRTVQRAWVTVFGNEYWHKAMESLDGEKVQVCVDQHDPSEVIIRDLKGVYICEAKLDGNKKDAFPLSLIDRQKQQRTQRRVAKLDDEVQKAKLELRRTFDVEIKQSFAQIADAHWIEHKDDNDDDDIIIYDYQANKRAV